MIRPKHNPLAVGGGSAKKKVVRTSLVFDDGRDDIETTVANYNNTIRHSLRQQHEHHHHTVKRDDLLYRLLLKCNLWKCLAIASVGMHFYRNFQTINNIPTPTYSDMPEEQIATSRATIFNEEDSMTYEPVVSSFDIDIEPTHAQSLCNPQNFLLLIKAGAKSKYQHRRKIWRDSTCPSSYKQHGLKYHFMLAMPAHEIIDPNGHNQGKGASSKEIEDMSILRNESRMHKDMVFLSIKDVYDDFYLKTLRIFEWAVDRGMTDETSVVVLHDDEYCLRPEVLQTICEDTVRSNSSLYAGSKLHLRNENSRYNIEPYFNGHMYALSSDLVRDIVHDPDTRFTSMSLGNSEDLQVGKWVHDQANRADNPLQIKYSVNRSLIWSFENLQEGVDCGSHRASSCAKCPQGEGGASWCNGECEWSSENGGACQSKALMISKQEAEIEESDYVCKPVAHPELRPELVHITKTGGTTLEIVGAMHNFTWGACHWKEKLIEMESSLHCPNSNVTKPPPLGPWGSKWHVPPKWLDSESKFWLKNATLFTVVRDPYARVVSSWNYKHKKQYSKVVNATAMNQWLEKIITEMHANRPVGDSVPKAAYFQEGLLIPQTDYITKDVRILRTETLERDFLCVVMVMIGHGQRRSLTRASVLIDSLLPILLPQQEH